MIDAKFQKILASYFSKEWVRRYDLENITNACNSFGNPQKNFKIIHIAGTNGKGSVSKMVFQVLKNAGKRVWVNTSPHLIDIRERFETQDGIISKEKFVEYSEKLMQYSGDMWYFERCVMLAFMFFKDMNCEYVVMEVGMWGKLDATNIVEPVLTIITSIGFDHMKFLWNTLEEISYEKAGIIKPRVPLILYWKNKTIEKVAVDREAQIVYPDTKIPTNLRWRHQQQNASLAYKAMEHLWFSGLLIRKSLMQVKHRGRLEFVRKNILIDGAHNEDGLKRLQEFLNFEKNNWKNIAYCIAVKKWKSPDTILKVFTKQSSWSLVQSESELVESAKICEQFFLEKWYMPQILQADDIFLRAAKYSKTLYVVFGSLYVIWDFIE